MCLKTHQVTVIIQRTMKTITMMSYMRLQPNSQKHPVTWERDVIVDKRGKSPSRAHLVTAVLVVLDVVCEFIETNSNEEEDGDAGPASHQEPRHVGLSWTGGVLFPRWSCLQSSHDYHHYQYWEANQVEDL